MANRKGVAIRLGTEGKAQVKSDFAEVRRAGEDAFKGIGDRAAETSAANQAQFNRLARGYDKAVAEMEAADRRRARNAEKLAALAPRTSLQATIDASVGSGGGKSARESAAAFRELLALEDAQTAKAAALRAVLDPLAAAQERYNRDLAEARALKAAGKISTEELAQAEAMLKTRLEESVGANDNATKAVGAYRFGMQNLGFQFSDFFVQMSGGTSAVRAFSLQAPQAVQAVAMMGMGAEQAEGKFAKFAAFMSTGYGAAITVGISLVGVLANELIGSGDAAEESKRKQRSLAEVLRDTTSSYREVIDALDDYNRAKEREAETTSKALEEQRKRIEANYEEALSIRENLKSALELAQHNASGDVYAAESQGFAINAVQSRIDANQADIDKVKQSLTNTRADIAGIFSDPEQKIRDHYKILREQAAASIDDVDKLTKKYAELRKEEEAALKAVRETNKGVSDSSQASLGDMVALVKQVFPGATITSTTGGRHVKGSDHYKGRAIDFVPAGGMGAYSKAQVHQMLLNAGVDIRRNAAGVEQFFGPGDKGHSDHFHLAWQGNADPQKAAEALKKLMDEAVRRQRDFEQASGSFDSKILQARRAALVDIDQLADFERDQVATEMEKSRLAIESKVKLGDLTRAQAEELEFKNALVATLETESIERKRQADKAKAAGELQDAIAGHQTELLRGQTDLAKTAGERRSLELAILDLEKQQARAHYEQVIALGELGQATKEQVKAAEDGLGSLDALFGLKTRGVLADTAGPLERYASEIDQTKAQIYERVQGFAVDELEYFRKGLDDAITRKLGVKDPFLAQLIDLFIEQWLIRPITAAMERASAGGGAGGGLGAFVSGVGGAISHLFGGSSAPTNLLAGTPYAGNAVGTENFSGGYTWLAENGPELVRLPRGSKVTPAAETRRQLGASNDNRAVNYQNFDLRGAVVTEDLLREMDRRSKATAEQVTQSGIAALIDRNKRSYGQLLSPVA